ncbi:hypothetical protein [Lutimonas vermicola]|uniref:Helicase/UvrB N-terminal domain-containing protein n=1 Tax=Lutimonas vermicola TaxID=414288 RepID=A0ABU9L2M5_9FLAO
MKYSELEKVFVKEKLDLKDSNIDIKIYDQIMGSGKTRDAIERMRQYEKDDQKFIYVTPFLDEIERVSEELNHVHAPKNYMKHVGFESQINDDGHFDILNYFNKLYKLQNKGNHLSDLIKQGKNIVTTHQLYSSFNSFDIPNLKDYILIIDEAINPVFVFNIGSRDLEILNNENLIQIEDKTSRVAKVDNDYTDDSFKSVLNFCKQENTFLQNNAFISISPIDLFLSFKEIQILTYLFEGSIMSAYFRLFNLEYTFINKCSQRTIKNKIKYNLTIYEGDRNQNSKRHQCNLSKSSIARKNRSEIQKLNLDTAYVFKRQFKTKSDDNAFTTFKDFEGKLSGNGYKKGFIAINARATNSHAHKKSMAYLGNRFLNPELKNFFISNGSPIDEDQWALSEMIQWIWRGCIRNNEPMNLYIPSYRMRYLLYTWLKA